MFDLQGTESEMLIVTLRAVIKDEHTKKQHIISWGNAGTFHAFSFLHCSESFIQFYSI